MLIQMLIQLITSPATASPLALQYFFLPPTAMTAKTNAKIQHIHINDKTNPAIPNPFVFSPQTRTPQCGQIIVFSSTSLPQFGQNFPSFFVATPQYGQISALPSISLPQCLQNIFLTSKLHA